MPQRRLLYLDGSALTAFLWQGGALREEARFPPDDEGHAGFSAYVGSHGASLFFLLVDLAEEDFRMESLPPVRGADRKALLARRLGQHFHGSPLATAISLGREATGRRDELVLFAALTRPQLVTPWLSVLGRTGAALAGLYSVPLLGAALLTRLRAVPTRCLLVTVTRAGLRQSYCEGRRVRFSRLIPLATPDPEEMAAACVAEVAKTRRYLLAQRLTAAEAPLAVIVLAHPRGLATFEAACRGGAELHFRVADLHAVARAWGLATLPEDSRSETLFLHLLIRRAPREQFLPPADRRCFRHWQARRALKRTGAAFLSACLLFAAVQLGEALELRRRSSAARAEAATAADRYAALRASFPLMPISPERLRELIDRFEALERRSAPLEALYLAVSRGLQEAPQVEIDRLDWRLGADPEHGKQKQAAKAGVQDPTDAVHAIALIHGMLPLALAGNPRGQLEAINALATALRADPSLKVSVLSLPFDMAPDKALKGDDSLLGTDRPRFLVRISRRL